MKGIIKLLALMMFALLIAGLLAILILQVTNQNTLEGISGISQFFAQNKWYFTFYRIALLSLIFWKWTFFISFLSSTFHWENETRSIFIEARWQILLWFIGFELVVNQNIIGYLIN